MQVLVSWINLHLMKMENMIDPLGPPFGGYIIILGQVTAKRKKQPYRNVPN